MADNNNQLPLQIEDVENAQRAILNLVLSYNGFPFSLNNTNVLVDGLSDGTSIGIFTLSGGVYKKQYISGSYIATFPFRLVYKSTTTKNKDTINAQKNLQALAEWLEKCSATFTDSHLDFQSIKRTSPVYELGVDEQSKQYSCTMQLEYFYKK